MAHARRTGDRTKGMPNTATIERALVAERTAGDAKVADRRLAEELIERFMELGLRSLAVAAEPSAVPEQQEPMSIQYGAGFESALAAIGEVHRHRANRELQVRSENLAIEERRDVPQDPRERAAFLAIFCLSMAARTAYFWPKHRRRNRQGAQRDYRAPTKVETGRHLAITKKALALAPYQGRKPTMDQT